MDISHGNRASRLCRGGGGEINRTKEGSRGVPDRAIWKKKGCCSPFATNLSTGDRGKGVKMKDPPCRQGIKVPWGTVTSPSREPFFLSTMGDWGIGPRQVPSCSGRVRRKKGENFFRDARGKKGARRLFFLQNGSFTLSRGRARKREEKTLLLGR